jgi:hypothetical protein
VATLCIAAPATDLNHSGLWQDYWLILLCHHRNDKFGLHSSAERGAEKHVRIESGEVEAFARTVETQAHTAAGRLAPFGLAFTTIRRISLLIRCRLHKGKPLLQSPIAERALPTPAIDPSEGQRSSTSLRP